MGDGISNIFLKYIFGIVQFRNQGSANANNPSGLTPQQIQAQGGMGDDSAHHRIFAFKNSSHAMSITSYIREKNNEDLFNETLDIDGSSQHMNDPASGANGASDRVFKILVCHPDHRNITTIFSTMEHITKEISDEVRNLVNEANKPDLILDKFLQDFILKAFTFLTIFKSTLYSVKIHTMTQNG